MSKISIIKIPLIVLYILGSLLCFLAIITFNQIHISIFDMVDMSSDITKLMEEFGTSSQLINNEMTSYFVVGILLFALPVAECIAILLIRGKIAFAVSIAGTIINNAVAFIVYDKLNHMISLINQAISFLSLDMNVELSKVTMTLWCVLYILIFLLSIAGLLVGEFIKKDLPVDTMRSILPEHIPGSANKNRQPELIPPQQAASAYIVPFYGALIGMSGMYHKKAKAFEKGQYLTVGSDEDSCHVLIDGMDCKAYGEISYDDALQEYRLQPFCPKSIFLKSGQPLGKDRIYCLPRGAEIVIGDNRNQFQLG